MTDHRSDMARAGRGRTAIREAILAVFLGAVGVCIGFAPLFEADIGAAPAGPVGDRMSDRVRAGRADLEASGCSDRDPTTGTLLSARTISPTAGIMLCQTAEVSVTVRTACDAPPLHVMFNLDGSGSMFGKPFDDAKAAILAMVDVLERADRLGTMVGFIVHRDPPFLALEMSDRFDRIRLAIERTMPHGGPDNLPQSVADARVELIRLGRVMDPRPAMLMIVLSDGGQTYSARNAIGPARRADTDGIIVASICIDNSLGDCITMADLASEPRFAFRERDTVAFTRIFETIVSAALDIDLRSLEVRERLPAGVDYVEGSAGPAADYSPARRELVWRADFVGDSGFRFGYRVRASDVGSYAIAGNSTTYRTTRLATGAIEVPTAVLAVTSLCPGDVTPTATWTATATSTPTLIPSPTSTMTASPTPTRSPTPIPTSTPVPAPVYLPLLNPLHCARTLRPTDTILLLDASTSMADTTASGRPKIEAAQEGALAFVDLMRPDDLTAVFAFNDSVIRLAELTDDRGALQRAVESIAVAPHTRIDLALDAAAEHLVSARHDPDHHPVIVMMTDGLPTNTTAEAVREAADGARSQATLFAIGVGPDVDRELLVDVAGDPGRYFPADDADALAAIYRQISERIPCEGG